MLYKWLMASGEAWAPPALHEAISGLLAASSDEFIAGAQQASARLGTPQKGLLRAQKVFSG